MEKESTTGRAHKADCACDLCKKQTPFEMPQDLFTSFLEDKLTVFAGAGISTEGFDVIGHSLSDEIKHELDISNTQIEFPSLVSKYCQRPNGRLRFIEKLNKRLKNVKTTILQKCHPISSGLGSQQKVVYDSHNKLG